MVCILEETEEEAVAVSHLVLIVTDPQGVHVRSGWYRDRLVNESGTWRFKERVIYTDRDGEAKFSALDGTLAAAALAAEAQPQS
jgi:hypothetical protein